MSRSITKTTVAVLYFTSSVFYLAAAYNNFLINNITTMQIVAGALMVTGNIAWIGASILDIMNTCKNQPSKDSVNELSYHIENKLDESKKIVHGSSHETMEV